MVWEYIKCKSERKKYFKVTKKKKKKEAATGKTLSIVKSRSTKDHKVLLVEFSILLLFIDHLYVSIPP